MPIWNRSPDSPSSRSLTSVESNFVNDTLNTFDKDKQSSNARTTKRDERARERKSEAFTNLSWPVFRSLNFNDRHSRRSMQSAQLHNFARCERARLSLFCIQYSPRRLRQCTIINNCLIKTIFLFCQRWRCGWLAVAKQRCLNRYEYLCVFM